MHKTAEKEGKNCVNYGWFISALLQKGHKKKMNIINEKVTRINKLLFMVYAWLRIYEKHFLSFYTDKKRIYDLFKKETLKLIENENCKFV